MADLPSSRNTPHQGGSALKGSTRPLLIGLLTMLLLLGIGMGMGIYQLRQMSQVLDNIVHESATAGSAIATMLRTARERMLILTEAIGMADAFDRDEKLLEFGRLGGEFNNARLRLAGLPLSAEEKSLRLRQEVYLQELIELLTRITDLARRDELVAAADLLRTEAIPAQSRVLDTLMHWVETRQALQNTQSEQARIDQKRAVNMMFGVGFIAVLVGLLVAGLVYLWNTRLIYRLSDNEVRLRGALAEQIFRQRAMDEHSIVSFSDTEGLITYVNDKFCQVSGYTREELLGANHSIVNSGFHTTQFYETLWMTILSGKVWQGVVKNRKKNGDYYWVETTIVPMLDEHGVPIRYISIRTEISHIMELEETVRQHNVMLQEKVLERTRELEVATQQLEQELADGERTQAELQQNYDELKSLHQQLQEAQQYLMQSEKLAAVGQLAAGMAHEINNPIGFVSSNLTMLSRYQDTLGEVLDRYLKSESSLPDEVREDIVTLRQKTDLDFLLEDTRSLLDETRSGVERVRKIVQDLRDFSRVDSTGQWQWADLNHCLNATLNLLGDRLGEGIEVRREFDELPQVECSPSELNQVFLNLLNNAVQAMPNGGHLTLRTGREGMMAFVEVEDSGNGIPDEALPHIFEPFYTTRSIGQGAGLGLSLAYGVIQNHCGKITVQSQVGTGSVFRVMLPIQRSNMSLVGEAPGSLNG